LLKVTVYQAIRLIWTYKMSVNLLLLDIELIRRWGLYKTYTRKGRHTVRLSVNRFVRGAITHPAIILAGMFVSALPVSTLAATPSGQILGDTQQATVNQPLAILSFEKQASVTTLAFDLGGSEKRKLELQLSEPLMLSANSSHLKSSSGVGSVFLDSSLSLHLNDNLDITSSLGAGKSPSSFQPLGSIHCQNGVLDRGSYRASDCHFINQANVLKQDQVALGLRYSGENFSSAVSMFKNDSSIGQRGVNSTATPVINPALGYGFPGIGQNNLFSTFGSGQALSYLDGETSGLDMEFQVGFTMDSAGTLQLGLQLTRVLDASYQAVSDYSPSLQNWTIASPFDSAKINVDWSKGNFSGGIQGFYREQVQFLNQEELDSSTSFDVHFTWRAPWNASLSVGTTNVLNSGAEDNGKPDNSMQDPFESVYGRIPYVRYQQDL